MIERDELVHYLDEYLGTYTMQDYGENGLQVEGAEQVSRLACAVDANLETIQGAIDARAGLLIVHHGLFWGKPLRVVGPHRRRIKALLDAGCSLYACHLPLDRHPEVGNNAQLAHLLGLSVVDGIGQAFGVPIGVIAEPADGGPHELGRSELIEKLTLAIGEPVLVLPGGPERVQRVAIISGDAANDIPAAALAACDTYITGETSHSAYHNAAEYGINVIYGGHYATETVGVKALAAHLAAKFDLPAIFIDRPTGL